MENFDTLVFPFYFLKIHFFVYAYLFFLHIFVRNSVPVLRIIKPDEKGKQVKILNSPAAVNFVKDSDEFATVCM